MGITRWDQQLAYSRLTDGYFRPIAEIRLGIVKNLLDGDIRPQDDVNSAWIELLGPAAY